MTDQHPNKKIALRHSFDIIAAAITVVAALAVLQTFVIGKHYLIPTMILFWGVLFGNLAFYGFQCRLWAKHILFWLFFVFTCHLFFAIFFSVRYRAILGDAWEYVGSALFAVFAFLTVTYARQNALFARTDGST